MPPTGRPTGYALFRQRLFRDLWTANLIHALGLVMLLLGVSWVMTSLTDDPVLVSMVQTVTSLPFLFFSIPAGVAADRWGHRRLLIAAQCWMLVMTAVLGVVAIPGWWDLRPIPLLAALFGISMGVVATSAAWKPLLHDMVTGDALTHNDLVSNNLVSNDLVSAISLNSLSNRIAQLLGPVLGGYLMGLAGLATLLFTRVVSHLIMLAALLRTPGPDPGTARPARARGALADGWRAVTGSASLYGPLIRCAMVMVPCGAVLALLPLEAKENIQTGVIGYSGLLAALGLGSTAGVSVLPLVRRRLRLNPLSAVCVGVFALAVIGISRWDSMILDAAFLMLLGLSWSILGTCHQVAVQSAAPAEIRGLATSFYAMTLQGSIALGSVVFGVLSRYAGVSRSILVAGLVATAGLLLVRRFPISGSERSAA